MPHHPDAQEVAMAWLWTDELARLLIELDGADPALLVDWTERPVGIRVDDSDATIETARLLVRNDG